MKKLFTLFVLAVLFSCSSDNDSAPTENIDPNLLQKVVFGQSTANERHWNFYENGLLKEITNAGGTILESFTYDGNGNLLTASGNPTSPGSHTFTYNSNNIITTVDGYPVAYGYDSAGGKYTFEFVVPDVEEAGIDFPHKTEIIVNSDLLPVSRKIFYNYPQGEVSFERMRSTYLDGNLKVSSQMGGETYQRHEFDTTTNPLKQALLPICRAMGMIEPSNYFSSSMREWHSGFYSSDNNVIDLKYALEDPESNTFTYTFNALGLPTTQISQHYDFGVPGGDPMTVTHYYYQGDDLP